MWTFEYMVYLAFQLDFNHRIYVSIPILLHGLYAERVIFFQLGNIYIGNLAQFIVFEGKNQKHVILTN